MVRSQVDRIDPVVKSRRRQKTNEPQAGLRTVDERDEIAWVAL